MPSDHQSTHLLMVDAHQDSGHRGRDGTLCRFRYQFWTTIGTAIANMVTRDCQQCKLRRPRMLAQSMGPLPDVRLKSATPFRNVMVDLFSPYQINGEVQKQITVEKVMELFTPTCFRELFTFRVFLVTIPLHSWVLIINMSVFVGGQSGYFLTLIRN